ncbi:MAG: sugar phosphate isomerase/epimerase [Opitutaceae bacterium]|nr:sugar phosphate isomerase/epimerase [Opitutaceae bacterium]
MASHTISFRGLRRAWLCAFSLLLSLGAPTLLALVDFDGDGLSDIWPETYPNAGAATADPDGDGATNFAESLAGTNPFDRASRLVASVPETDASGNTLLRWSGVAGKRYRIDSSADLVTWTLGTELLTAADSPRLVRAAGAASGPRLFWRVTALDTDTDGDGVNDWEESRLGSDPAVPAVQLQSHFVPFGMCFGDLTAAEQIARCQSRGFSGLGIQNFDLSSLKDFAANGEVTSGRCKIYSVLWFPNFDVSLDSAPLTDLDKKLTELAKMKAALWLAMDSPDRKEATLAAGAAAIRIIAEHCRTKGVQLVLYPHGGALFDDAEAALAMRNRVGLPEIKISVHLCHEIMAGNGARIAAVVAAVKDHIAMASVSGSSIAVYPNDNWAHQIQPLDRGDYDIRPFLQALAAAGYTGPMQLQTYNLGDPGATPTATDHLTRSMKKWRTLVAPTAHRP